MKFRKNVISLGAGQIASVRAVGDIVEFFMASDGVIVRKTFDTKTRSLKTDASPVSLASHYLRLDKGAVECLGELVYVAAEL